MKLLLDTNIVIPLEPLHGGQLDANTGVALELARYATLGGHQLYIHPEIRTDLGRDPNESRRATRLIQRQRYPELPSPPGTDEIERVLGAARSDNDRVDNTLLAAVHADAVDYLVTEDDGIQRKARRLGLETRVLGLAAAIDVLRDLYDEVPPPPPFVRPAKAHALNASDPIFESFRRDYAGFPDWFAGVRRQHRDTWIIEARDGSYGGVTIIKREDGAEIGLKGKVLKICSFKVAAHANGVKFGELLLKTIFAYCRANRYEGVYLTVLPKYEALIHLLTQFGFQAHHTLTRLNELVLIKQLVPAGADTFDALTYHILFGPGVVRSYESDPGFVVPIRPEYHDALFPDAAPQPMLPMLTATHSKPFGNAIRKAYLCKAKTRKISPGDNLFFYRSTDLREISCTGVVEQVAVLRQPEQVARLVGTRTVYRFDEIAKMCGSSDVLVLLFRHSRTLEMPLRFETLLKNNVLKDRPQSIVSLSPDARNWLSTAISSQS